MLTAVRIRQRSARQVVVCVSVSRISALPTAFKMEGGGLDLARGTFKDHTSSFDIGVSAKVRRISKFTLPRENTRHFNILNVFTRVLRMPWDCVLRE